MHTHDHSHEGHVHLSNSDEKKSLNNYLWAFLLNLIFTIVELVGGVLSNSIAVLSDALHDFGDTIALGMAYYFEKKSYKKRDSNYTYGYKRLSTLSGFIASLILVSGSIFILYHSLIRLFNPEEVVSEYVFFMAILGIAFNGLGYFKLSKEDKLNAKVVRLHLMEDLLGWVALLIASIFIYFTNWYILDPLLSIAVTVFIFYNAVKNIRYFLRIFLQGIPNKIDESQLIENLKSIDGVISVHDLHIWTLDGNYNIGSMHLVINDNTSNENQKRIKSDARDITRKAGIQHETLELGFENENCDFTEC